MREKLIELISEADKADYESMTQDEHYALMADKLIENGVGLNLPAETAILGRPNYEEELKIRCAEIADLKHALAVTNDERSKLGSQYENALKTIDELHRIVEHLKGQIEAYQYCMNCRR